MPSIDQNIPTMTNAVEVFNTYKSNEDSKESDDESLHLQLDEDEEPEAKTADTVKTQIETEDDILNKFDPDYGNKCNGTIIEEYHKSPNEDRGGDEKDQNCEQEEMIKDREEDKQEASADEEMKETEDNTKEKTDDSSKEENTTNSSSTTTTTTTIVTEEKVNSPKVDADEEKEMIDDKDTENKDDKEEDKCENDTEEDLLDVSRIRDAEEDNADNVSNEECDEDMNDKIDNDENSTNEQTNNNNNNNNHNNKNDEVEIDETNLEMNCNEEDKNQKSNEETDDKNKDHSSNSNDKNDNTIENHIQDEEMKEASSLPANKNENRNSSKRSLDSDDDSNNNNNNNISDGSSNVIKRQRLEENLQIAKDKLSDNSDKASQRPIVLQSIDYFKDFMKKKDYKISVYDLEELCLQKTSEVIQYCSRLGDARHQLQLQEQLVESLRKDLQQVMKQARDLEIVNRKLMVDLKQYMAALSTAPTPATVPAPTTTTAAATTPGKTDTTTTASTLSSTSTTPTKPLQPLKITRSVGLQVRFTPAYEAVSAAAVKRRQSLVLTHQKVPLLSLTTNKNQKSNNTRQQGIATRSRNSTAVPPPPTAAATVATTSTTTTTTTTSIIDLTDEDDKQNKRPSTTVAATTTTTSAQNRGIVARSSLPLRQNNQQIQSVRTVTSNIRLTSTTTTKQMNNSVGTTPTTKHSMYLVQSISPTMLTSSLTTAAKVVLSLQQPNGVLNGPTVSVIQKPTPSIQVKPVHALKAPPTTTTVNGASSNGGSNKRSTNQHPAPLPLPPSPPSNKFDKQLKPIPPKPHLTIRKTDTGIILQWRMPYELDMYEVIASYQLFAYQETNATPDTDMWRRVGDVKALALPMACTLTQFADNNKYYFAVRPVDIHKRIGAFSDPEEISL